jgi:aromatic ring-opening dioxygenase catalytic subunit (LigB family)
MTVTAPKTREEWLKVFDDLPSSAKIPAFFFAHGSPMLEIDIPGTSMSKSGALRQFLEDFGKLLVEKYSPKAIVVFSAHWDTDGTQLGM